MVLSLVLEVSVPACLAILVLIVVTVPQTTTAFLMDFATVFRDFSRKIHMGRQTGIFKICGGQGFSTLYKRVISLGEYIFGMMPPAKLGSWEDLSFQEML